jgi:divalent metal cation (Fe/Co/Zn/Cd) transporter
MIFRVPLLKADAWHHLSDSLTSGMAFIGISLALVLGEGYEAADDYAALLSSLIIAFNALLILKPALLELLRYGTRSKLC